ncbi:MAG: GAF domain-containing protein [Anaerolineaceae bacterium]|nr:GAF domain-containing protein [Anaerolineaceae bacterium]
MTLNEFLTLIIQVTLVLIAVLTFANYIRRRDQIRLDIALLFGAFAYIVFIQRLLVNPGPNEALNRWLSLSIPLVLMAHPYLLLRLVLDFRPVPAAVWWFAIIGLVVSWALMIFVPSVPTTMTVAFVAYFVYVELYAAVAFVRGAMATAGVTHWRMALAASGSGLLALWAFAGGVTAVLPGLASVFETLNQFIALFAVLAYYAGFATPVWLRRYWQLREMQRFLRQTSGPWTGEPITSTLDRLCQMTMRAMGGTAAMVVLWDEKESHLVIGASTDEISLPTGRRVDSEAIWRSWQSQTPLVGLIPTDFSIKETPIAVGLGAKATIIVPIMNQERAWGILQVFNRRKSLFPTDDLNLLALFAEQTAIALGYASLVSEQQALIQKLSWRTQQLEAAYSELESFSYSVSHDLRAPLRHVSGYMELLQKYVAETLDAKANRYIQISLDEARRMGILIDDLLAFSRFGRSEIRWTEVDFDQLVKEVIADFEPELQERQVRWHIHTLPMVQGDRTMLRLVWSNLISNALKFSREQEEAEVEIGVEPSGTAYTFFVRDNGKGFDMQYVGQLFGVFQRLHKVSEFEGTGIGLATVRRVVQRHGGRCWAEGKEGEGATFYFTLPTAGAETAVTTHPDAKRNEDGGVKAGETQTDFIG